MNKLMIIGNLVRDPEIRTTTAGRNVCSFTVAVNKKIGEGADFFRVSAWNGLADICKKYLLKGRKVCVIGPVSVHTYTDSKGDTKASLEVNADDVEFLSSGNTQTDAQTGFQKVEDDDCPF